MHKFSQIHVIAARPRYGPSGDRRPLEHETVYQRDIAQYTPREPSNGHFENGRNSDDKPQSNSENLAFNGSFRLCPEKKALYPIAPAPALTEGNEPSALSTDEKNKLQTEKQRHHKVEGTLDINVRKSRVFKTDSLAELSNANFFRSVQGDDADSWDGGSLAGGPLQGDSSNTASLTMDEMFESKMRELNWREFVHILVWTYKLWPSIVLVGAGIFLTALPTVCLEFLLCFTIVSIAEFYFEKPWDPLMTMAYFSISFCMWSTFSLQFLQIICGASPLDIMPHLVAFSIGISSGFSMIFITGYGYVTFVTFDSWLTEWIVSGLTFPLLSVIVGRLMVADYISFAMLWAFPTGSSRAVMSFFSICVKVNFHLASQIGILLIDSQVAFAMAVGVSCLTEVVGTYFNVVMTKAMQKRSSGMHVHPSSRNIILHWMALRAAVSKEKLILHVHDESVGEKLVVFAATASVMMTVSNDASVADADRPRTMHKVLIRGLILFAAEIMQDFFQRFVLLHVGRLTATVIKPRFLTVRENLNIIVLILMTLNLFSVSEWLNWINTCEIEQGNATKCFATRVFNLVGLGVRVVVLVVILVIVFEKLELVGRCNLSMQAWRHQACSSVQIAPETMVHVVALVTGGSAAIALLACIGYGLITQRKYSWHAEWLIAGVAFPLVSLLAGRLLVADVISFALLWAFPEGSSTSVLTFFSLVVKIAFYLPGQVALLGLRSWTAFLLSIVATSFSEIFGTYVNAKMTRMLHRKAQSFEIDEESQNFVRQWVAVRAAVSDEKLVLHTHNELIGEKVVLCAAIAAILQSEATLQGEATSAGDLLSRGLLLAFAEMLQDFLQRRVLLATAGLSVTGIPPRILSLSENFCISCQLLMTLNLLKTSQSLLEINE
ncbi:Hypothetical Protein FCC1311_087772 [Hondaea fermentalgiana]|uniref:Uncharacterized protein n=1 Tax=Hondaea fermentalgiana TaxID=2315210 RepID=A0A2R5GV72_9STRA|nr:Hypothetical Protein FCC1311_087772 [Hondaea fermentalgiana]|eukprot:GBG32553.1 Hypothetical Protein FCC1311_087772 [Hondaea fermentalgiana]